jgi:hypothetical protein
MALFEISTSGVIKCKIKNQVLDLKRLNDFEISERLIYLQVNLYLLNYEFYLIIFF